MPAAYGHQASSVCVPKTFNCGKGRRRSRLFLQGTTADASTGGQGGGFAVLPKGMFHDKAVEAVGRNFVTKNVKTSKVKAQAIELCKDLALDRLSRAVNNCKRNSLELFFTVKTHKDDKPFRCIVSERDTWQREISSFLQKCLRNLVIQDPFVVKNSGDVVSFLQGSSSLGYAVSFDIENLFFSIPHEDLFCAVRSCIDENGVVDFQNTSGLTVDNFMKLLEFYLESTFVTFDNRFHVQRQGICIGSCVAPVLANIFLASIDRDLVCYLDDKIVLRVFRYVDDYLVIFKKQPGLTHTVTVQETLSVFKRHGRGLTFTHELPEQDRLQFLDINITLTPDHTCWMYSPRARKDLLPFESAHSKTVKRAIVMLCLKEALQKSCVHLVKDSLNNQIGRLQKAGFPVSVVAAVAEKLLQGLKPRTPREGGGQPKTRPAVLPYIHRVSHNLKNVANRYGVPVVFSARASWPLCAPDCLRRGMRARLHETSRHPVCQVFGRGCV